MAEVLDLTGSDAAVVAAAVAAAMPRWHVCDDSPYGSSTLLVDRGHEAGLVVLGHSHDGWSASYYDSHHTYRKERLAETSSYYDDGIYSAMAIMGVPDPVGLPIPADDPASTFRRIERMRDEQLLEEAAVRRFRDRLAEAFRASLSVSGEPWESNGSLDAPTGGYVQWTRMDDVGTPVHVEVSDGSEYAEPLDPRLVQLLVDLGWNAPDEEFRNGWTRALRADEVDRAARLVATTLVVALGVETWQLSWDRLTR